MAIKVKIIYEADENIRNIGKFYLSFNDNAGVEHLVNTKFEMDQLWDFAQDKTSVAFDFLITSMLIYNIDRALSRESLSLDGWRREITVNDIPTLNLNAMLAGKQLLDSAVSFLTGDDWNLNFSQAELYNYEPIPKKTYEVQKYSKVALFSGGLDSLIGFVDEAYSLESENRILLISHKEQGKEGGDQKRILDICCKNHFYEDKYDRILVNAGLKANVSLSKESTFRSRSLLFFAIGIYAAHKISKTMQVIVPENGTISINIPLDKGRRSACSTRTTHPTFIKRLEQALQAIGINNTFKNPYKFKTKADMMDDCFQNSEKKRILKALYKSSCSCAKRSHNFFWDNHPSAIIHDEKSIRHCGMCLPCIYRRVALDIVGLDKPSLLGTDIFHGIKYNLNDIHQKRSSDFRSLLKFLRTRANEKTIEKELLLNGITEPQALSQYVDLAMRSYNQVRAWINKKGTDDIKHRADIV